MHCTYTKCVGARGGDGREAQEAQRERWKIQGRDVNKPLCWGIAAWAAVQVHGAICHGGSVYQQEHKERAGCRRCQPGRAPHGCSRSSRGVRDNVPCALGHTLALGSTHQLAQQQQAAGVHHRGAHSRYETPAGTLFSSRPAHHQSCLPACRPPVAKQQSPVAAGCLCVRRWRSAAAALRAAWRRCLRHVHRIWDVQLLLSLIAQRVAGNCLESVVNVEVLLG